MPTFRSPVSGSLVTTHGSVMKRPPSKGQHFWIGRSFRVGGFGGNDAGFVTSGAGGHPGGTPVLPGNLVITSLQGPSFTILGLACRRSSAVERSLIASLRVAGGLALTSVPSSAATSSTLAAPRLIAMRFQEPIVLMARGNGLVAPLTVGFSINRALPPLGLFISRSANSVISSSVAIGSEMR